MATFEWYEKVEEQEIFEQGDLFENFPVPIVTTWDMGTQGESNNTVTTPASFTRYNLILMTQSCDLQRLGDAATVVFCPRQDYRDAAEEISAYRGQDGWAKLRAGRIIGAHLLAKCEIEGHRFDYQVVALRQVLSVPFGLLKAYSRQHAKSRIRLLPPYREHLAQAFARQFMRVGLPVDLPTSYPTI